MAIDLPDDFSTVMAAIADFNEEKLEVIPFIKILKIRCWKVKVNP